MTTRKFETKLVTINAYSRNVSVILAEEVLAAQVGSREFRWDFKKELYPVGKVSDANSDKYIAYVRLYILERLKMDGVELKHKRMEKKSDKIEVKAEFTRYIINENEYLDLFVNGYIRGKLEGIGEFTWDSKKYKNILPLNKRGANGFAGGKMPSSLVTGRLKELGYTSFNNLRDNCEAVSAEEVIKNEYRKQAKEDEAFKAVENKAFDYASKSIVKDMLIADNMLVVIKTKNIDKMKAYGVFCREQGYNETVMNELVKIYKLMAAK